jgi:predicted SprT family Zn-dependent metalloprotease
MTPRKPDALSSYRETTSRMANAPGMTFKCCRCQKGKSILGRKKVAQDGRRVSYVCKACQEGK